MKTTFDFKCNIIKQTYYYIIIQFEKRFYTIHVSQQMYYSCSEHVTYNFAYLNRLGIFKY